MSSGKTPDAVRKLASVCSGFGLDTPVEARDKFGQYIDLILHYGATTNLVGRADADSIATDLIADCVQFLRFGPLPHSVLDVGSGAGLPAIPLKIMSPDTTMELLEPRTKRYAFLQTVISRLGLVGISVRRTKFNAADYTDDVPGLVTSKAFAPLKDWLDMTRPLARRGSRIACMASAQAWDACGGDIRGLGYEATHLLREGPRVYAVMSLEGGDE